MVFDRIELLMGTPPTVAVDHAVTCESPCMPKTRISADFEDI